MSQFDMEIPLSKVIKLRTFTLVLVPSVLENLIREAVPQYLKQVKVAHSATKLGMADLQVCCGAEGSALR